MEPKIIELPEIVLVGFNFYGDPFRLSGGWTEENEIGHLWARFMAYLQKHSDRLPPLKDDRVCYEVHIQHPETAERGEYEVFVGLEVRKLEHLPVELSVKVLPAREYAVFTLKGEQITSDWEQGVVGKWFARSGLHTDESFGFERYDERFKGLDRVEESALEVYVPLSPEANSFEAVP